MSKHMSDAEAQVLEASLPDGLTDPMRELALCLYRALVEHDARAGATAPSGEWQRALIATAAAVVRQLEVVAEHIGGGAIYIAKGVLVRLSARDREMCAKFRGNNYTQLAREYDLTEMRIRQIVGAWMAEERARRQGNLPGFDADDAP